MANWPGDGALPWDKDKSYFKGDVVSYKGYLYVAMSNTSPNDNPRTATGTFTLNPDASYTKYSIDPEEQALPVDVTMRKWTVYDFPAYVYMEKLRGLPRDSTYPTFTTERNLSYLTVSLQFQTICVRNMKTGYDDETDFMIPPKVASYSGYGMPAGMLAEYDTYEGSGFFGEWIYSASAGVWIDTGVPKDYRYFGGLLSGACFSPNTVAAEIRSEFVDGDLTYYSMPAYTAETPGAMFSSMATFSRVYDYGYVDTDSDPVVILPLSDFTTMAFQDNWENATPAYFQATDYILVGPTGTDPDFKDG